MSGLRVVDEWVAHLIAATLGAVFVHPHDGADAATYDFDVERDGKVFASVVVAVAADDDCLELWRLVNDHDQRWVERSLKKSWTVALYPYARASVIRHRLPTLLAGLERDGRPSLSTAAADPDDPSASAARRIGVAAADSDDAAFPGSVLLSVQQLPEAPAERGAGATGDALGSWVTAWLHDAAQESELARLQSSSAAERHLVVVFPGFTTAPAGVIHLLVADEPRLPAIAPELPPQVTHVWALSTWAAGRGFRWSRDEGWSTFHKL